MVTNKVPMVSFVCSDDDVEFLLYVALALNIKTTIPSLDNHQITR